MKPLQSHNLVETDFKEIIFEKHPCLDKSGKEIKGLFNGWIWLNNPKQFNSYTTAAVKEIILAFRQASNDRSVVAVVFTAVGDKAFCTGGNTKEYIDLVKSYTNVPCCLGFGISSVETVREVKNYCDGVIIGSAIIKRISEAKS